MVNVVDDHEFAGRGAHAYDSFGSYPAVGLLKRIYLTLPTLDLALFTTNLLTDDMSHEDYAWWFHALNYFLGPLP
jgi:hypothetical protein